MLGYLLDVVFLLVVGVTAFLVSRRLLLESALILLAIVLSSLVAMSSFEPLVNWCRTRLFLDSDMTIANYMWFATAFFIFALVFSILIQEFLRLVGPPPQFGRRAESLGCWALGAMSGYVLAAFLLTIAQTLPFPRDFWGSLEPNAERRSSPVMAMAPDYQYLSLVEYTCTPRSAITGAPWKPGGPVMSTSLDQGDWSSFPLRYALWREQVTSFPPEFEGEDFEDDYSEEEYSEDSPDTLADEDEAVLEVVETEAVKPDAVGKSDLIEEEKQ